MRDAASLATQATLGSHPAAACTSTGGYTSTVGSTSIVGVVNVWDKCFNFFN